jgi:hypothetical protein
MKYFMLFSGSEHATQPIPEQIQNTLQGQSPHKEPPNTLPFTDLISRITSAF